MLSQHKCCTLVRALVMTVLYVSTCVSINFQHVFFFFSKRRLLAWQPWRDKLVLTEIALCSRSTVKVEAFQRVKLLAG